MWLFRPQTGVKIYDRLGGDSMKATVDPINEAWSKKFSDVLRRTRSVTAACKQCNLSRTEAYALRNVDADFKARWDEAYETNIDDLEASTLRRAIEGWEDPVFYKGRICGYRRQFSPTLTLAMLRAHRPSRYANLLDKDDAQEFAQQLAQATQMMRGSIPNGKA